jgi:PHP family Zn ribbon phosphoesterase
VKKEDFVKEKVDEKLIELFLLNREGKLKVKPGFDGQYGKVLLPEKQARLF